MNLDYTGFFSIEDVLADVTVAVGDEEMRELNIGFYRRMVKDSLRKLNFETHFDKRSQDLDVPASLIVPFPVGGYNLHEIFLFNTPDNTLETSDTVMDCCGIESMTRVFYKKNFIRRGENTGYTAEIKSNTPDPFYYSFIDEDAIFFYNIQNGMIMLSDSCAAYEKMRVVYEGDPADIDKSKIIPPLAREGIVAFVTERAFFHLKIRDPKYRQAWMDAKADLVDRWRDAEYYMKRMDTKARNDLNQYLSRLNY